MSIRKLPSKNEVRRMVDDLITPERGDLEVRCLITLLQAATDENGNWENYEVGLVAQHHAFTYTAAFDEAFREFAGIKETVFEEKEKVSEVFETVN